MGCGRVGSSLAIELESAGHSVSVIDQARESFRRLGPNFKGHTVTGMGFDRDTLFAAVSNGDNSNILAARVARETYKVANVVARIYDPGRAEIYQRLGIPTVATVLWTTDQILRRILPEGSKSEWRDASGAIQLCEFHPVSNWFGIPVSTIENITGARVAFITRLGAGLIPDEHTVFQEGDLLHMMVRDEDLANVEKSFSHAPETAS